MGGSELARAVLDACRNRDLKLATAESCTGGMVAARLTDVPGSSAVVDCGMVTYSNQAKAQILGVDFALITEHGAVSAEVAAAMVRGALEHSAADVAVAITGIAGPGGGSAAKPEGLVHFACQRQNGPIAHTKKEFGPIGRSQVRERSVEQALQMLLDAVTA